MTAWLKYHFSVLCNRLNQLKISLSSFSLIVFYFFLFNSSILSQNLVNQKSIPDVLKKKPQNFCVIGLTTEAERLVDIRKNRMNSLKETKSQDYTDLEKIKKEVQDAKELFKKYSWPSIDVTRKSVEETAASVIKIHEIYISKKNG